MLSSTESDAERGAAVLNWCDDIANAKNWSLGKRTYNTAIPSLLCLTMSVKPRSRYHRNHSPTN